MIEMMDTPTMVDEPLAVDDGPSTIEPGHALVGGMAHPDLSLTPAHHPHAPRSEQLRALRTELMMRPEDSDRGEVVTLLSPGCGEGRSQLAAELAITFAQLGRPTLLLDADMRHPRQHLLFGVDNRHGLSRMLAEGRPPRLYPVSGMPHLMLHPAGAPPSNPVELLSSPAFEQALRRYRQDYDFVVIDTPPLGTYADALAVINLARRGLVLTRAQRTRYQETRQMLRRLAATRAQILGSVINHF